jgi:hypothetical protein
VVVSTATINYPAAGAAILAVILYDLYSRRMSMPHLIEKFLEIVLEFVAFLLEVVNFFLVILAALLDILATVAGVLSAVFGMAASVLWLLLLLIAPIVIALVL